MKSLKADSKFENDSVYSAEGDIVEITLADTERTWDRGFLSVHDSHRGYLDVAFHMRGLRNVTLDFKGATLLLRGRIQPFIIDDCENITVKNVTVEYERSFFSEFDIVSNKNGELRMTPKAKFPCRTENGYLIPYAETWENRDLHRGNMFLQAYDTQSGDGRGAAVVVIGEEIIRGETPPCPVQHLRVREDGGDVILYGGQIPREWEYGMTAVLSHETRDKSSVFIRRSKDITIENYRILNGAGMGIVAMYSENLTLDGLKLFRDKRSHGLVTNAADAAHLAACKGKIIIKNSVFEGMTDDAVNVHTNFVSVLSCDGNRIRVLKNPASHCLDAYFIKHGRGDRIAVYNGRTMEKKSEYILTDCRITGDCETELTANRPADGIKEGDLIENLSTQPELTVSGCVFGKSNSHLRIQTRGKTVMENCRCSLPVLLTGDTNYWFEASPVNDMTVAGCEFRGRGRILSVPEFSPTPAAPDYHSGLKIIGNSFETQEPIDAYGTDDIWYENVNAFSQDMHIVLRNCGKCVTFNCEVIRHYN